MSVQSTYMHSASVIISTDMFFELQNVNNMYNALDAWISYSFVLYINMQTSKWLVSHLNHKYKYIMDHLLDHVCITTNSMGHGWSLIYCPTIVVVTMFKVLSLSVV